VEILNAQTRALAGPTAWTMIKPISQLNGDMNEIYHTHASILLVTTMLRSNLLVKAVLCSNFARIQALADPTAWTMIKPVLVAFLPLNENYHTIASISPVNIMLRSNFITSKDHAVYVTSHDYAV
jgi:hypothetical protein